MLAAHDPVTTSPRKTQHRSGKLVNQGRHIAQTPPLWTSCSRRRHTRQGRTTRWREEKPTPSPRLDTRVYDGNEPPHLGAAIRTRPPCHTRTIIRGNRKAPRGEIEEHVVAVRLPLLRSNRRGYPDTHATIRPTTKAEAQVNQHQPLLHASPLRTRKRLRTPPQVEGRRTLLTADRNLRMDTVGGEGRRPPGRSEPRVPEGEVHPA